MEPRPADAMRRIAQGRWQECCGRVMVPATKSIDAPDSDPTPWADRRLFDRRAPRAGTRIEIRRGAMGLSPDVVIELIDLTEAGAKVRIRGHVRRGDRVLTRLSALGQAWVAGGTAVVRWCLVGPDGTALVGVQFERPLDARDLAELVSGLI
jgi:PilZ domain